MDVCISGPPEGSRRGGFSKGTPPTSNTWRDRRPHRRVDHLKIEEKMSPTSRKLQSEDLWRTLKCLDIKQASSWPILRVSVQINHVNQVGLFLTLTSSLPTPLLEKPEEFCWKRGGIEEDGKILKRPLGPSASASLCVSPPAAVRKEKLYWWEIALI